MRAHLDLGEIALVMREGEEGYRPSLAIRHTVALFSSALLPYQQCADSDVRLPGDLTPTTPRCTSTVALPIPTGATGPTSGVRGRLRQVCM